MLLGPNSIIGESDLAKNVPQNVRTTKATVLSINADLYIISRKVSNISIKIGVQLLNIK